MTNVDDYYYYPNSSMLRNKLNTRFQSELDEKEKYLSQARYLQLRNDASCLGDQIFDFEYLKSIHRYLFQDVYEWAGDAKLQNTYKKNMHYVDVTDIPRCAKEIFGDVKKSFATNMRSDEFCEKAGQLLYDIHFLHPFREGNTRSELTYIKLLSEYCSVGLDYTAVSYTEWKNTIHRANNSKSVDPFVEYLNKCHDEFERKAKTFSFEKQLNGVQTLAEEKGLLGNSEELTEKVR